MPEIQLPIKLIRDPEVSMTAKVIYMLFAANVDVQMQVQLSRQDILSTLNLAHRTYYNHLETLLKKSYIERCGQPNYKGSFQTMIFRLTPQEGAMCRLGSDRLLQAGLSVNVIGLYLRLWAELISSIQDGQEINSTCFDTVFELPKSNEKKLRQLSQKGFIEIHPVPRCMCTSVIKFQLKPV